MNYEFVGTCVGEGPGFREAIEEMEDASQTITYEEFIAAVPLEQAVEIIGGGCYKTGIPTLERDWAVRFYKSFYKGRPCVWVDWSAIDHIFCPVEETQCQ